MYQSFWWKTRHTLGIGPVLSFFRSKTKTFRGISGHYEYCPFSYSEKLSFGVRYSLAYTFQKTHYDEFMEWSPGQFYSTSFKSEWHALDNYIGYTLKIRLYRNLSLENSLGFGVQFYNYNTSTDIAENKTLSWSYSSGNIFLKVKVPVYLWLVWDMISGKVNNSLVLLAWAIFSALLLPSLVKDGMFLDGLVNSSMARNLAFGDGGFWTLHYTKAFLFHFMINFHWP